MNKTRRKQLDKAWGLLMEASQIIEEVKSDEEEAHDNLPDSLQESERGEQMQEYIDTMDELLMELDNILSDVDDIVNG